MPGGPNITGSVGMTLLCKILKPIYFRERMCCYSKIEASEMEAMVNLVTKFPPMGSSIFE